MANMIPISTVVVGSGGANTIEFNNIPQGYTDLILKLSGRTTTPTSVGESVFISFNGNTSSYSGRLLYGTGSAVGSDALAGEPRYAGTQNSGSSTGSVFASIEIYIPNYISSNNKSYSVDGVTENNATESYQNLSAGLWSNTSPINTISLSPNSANKFAQHSTATLYGIRKY